MLTTRVQITAVDHVPSVRDRMIACKYCGFEVPRWARKVSADDQPISGLRRMAAHEIAEHSGEGVA